MYNDFFLSPAFAILFNIVASHTSSEGNAIQQYSAVIVNPTRRLRVLAAGCGNLRHLPGCLFHASPIIPFYP
jgi:hypothetical protein